MKKSTLCAITLAALPGFASADTLFGLYAGVGSWQSEFSGNLNTSADSTIDLEGDLGFDNDDELWDDEWEETETVETKKGSD